jgi:hypothetical protein
MTPKEKATELLWEYLPILNGWTSNEKTELAKKCAFVSIQAVIDACEYNNVETYNTDWWLKVREELKNLRKQLNLGVVKPMLLCIDSEYTQDLEETKKYELLFEEDDQYFLRDDSGEVWGYDKIKFKVIEAQ